jgi:hypothetical protein
VDDSTLDSQTYKLVMIGRKVREDDESNLVASFDSSQHAISSEVFHESGEKFKDGIKRDEGIL